MFQAAMHGFPNPPQGPRVVNIQIGGASQQAAAPVRPAVASPAAPAPVAPTPAR
jgi:hypothetical protein